MTDPIGAEAIIEKIKKYLIPCVYHFYRNPPQLVRGEGTRLFDAEGKSYLDLYSGVSVNVLGHCHPDITQAVCEQVRTLQHTTTIYLTQPIVELAELLAGVLPGNLSKTFFCASGSEANEGAALLATLFTGRSGFLALEKGLHGRTKLTMSLTGLPMWRTDPEPLPGIAHVPPPDCVHCPFGRSYGSCSCECVEAVDQAIRSRSGEVPAAMFVEPVQGNGGITVPPPEYFPRVRKILDTHGILLIVDEVQTGFGRTGRMFAIEHWNTIPDIVTGGKALGGGTPIGFFSTRDEIASAYTRPGASTFGGNPVTAEAGITVLRILTRDALVERSAQLGRALKERLKDLAARFECIRDVRGLGLMIGVEFQGAGELSPADLTDRILEDLKESGFLPGKTGPDRNVLTFMPPLTIEKSDLERAVDALEHVLMSVCPSGIRDA